MRAGSLNTAESPLSPTASSPSAAPRGRALGITAIVAIGPILLVAIAAWMRVTELDHLPGVNGDEAWSGAQAMRIVRGEAFAWRTPTGNPVNPFFLGPLTALHFALPPSFAALRSVAAASGLVALGASFWFARRLFGVRASVIVLALLAVMPINITYSRFAWDASQSLLATTCAVYPALLAVADRARKARWLSVAAAGQAAAILVHPTNIFVAPFVVVSAGVCYWHCVSRFAQRWRDAAFRRWCIGIIVAMGLVAGWIADHWVRLAWIRIRSLPEFLEFALNWVRLVSGDTVYRYISGALPPALESSTAIPVVTPRDLFAMGVIAIVLYGVRRHWRQRPSGVDATLLLGAALTLIGFYLVAGPKAAGPNFERYSICLIAPTALVFARGISWWLLRTGWRWPLAAVAWSCLAAVWLRDFQQNYFEFQRATGGAAHLTFRTAAVEPKRRLYEIVARQSAGEPTRLICPEWWIYWPVEYLALGGSSVQVAQSECDAGRGTRGDEPSDGLSRDVSICHAQFCGEADESATLARLAELGIAPIRDDVVDYAGRPLISLLKWSENRLEKNEAEPFDNRQSRPRF